MLYPGGQEWGLFCLLISDPFLGTYIDIQLDKTGASYVLCALPYLTLV
jgi:hypothetical protein